MAPRVGIITHTEEEAVAAVPVLARVPVLAPGAEGQDAAKRTHTENGISEEPRKMKEADRGDFEKRSIIINLRRSRRRFADLFVRADTSAILFYYI